MRELIAVWQHTRFMVLIAFCAAIFVAVLLPFKFLTIIPNITEIRPAMALPVVFSIFFGPVAPWAASFGNTIGDLFGGTISPATAFGFIGNLIYGFVPYRVVSTYLKPEKSLFSTAGWAVFLFATFLASAICATIISLGVDLLKIVAFPFLVHTIFLNNFVMSLVLGPLLIRALDKRIKQMQLGYQQVMEPSEISTPKFGRAGAIIMFILVLGIYGIMMVPSLQFSPIAEHQSAFKLLSIILLPVAALIFL